MKRTVMLLALAGLILPGAAAAASGSANAAADATVAFYSGFPGSGGSLVTKVNAGAEAAASAQKAIAQADSAVITLSGHAYTFAVDQAASTEAQPELDVKGALQATGHGRAKVATVVQELAKAQDGQQPLVVLSRDQGSGQVVVALYHPDGGNTGLRVRNADHATVWVNGKMHEYKVTSGGNGGVISSLQVQVSNGQQTLTSTVADLQTQVALNASGSTSSSAGSGSASGSGSVGLNVTVGGGN